MVNTPNAVPAPALQLVELSYEHSHTLPASREIAGRIEPDGERDIASLVRSCHHSGPLMGHVLACLPPPVPTG